VLCVGGLGFCAGFVCVGLGGVFRAAEGAGLGEGAAYEAGVGSCAGYCFALVFISFAATRDIHS